MGASSFAKFTVMMIARKGLLV